MAQGRIIVSRTAWEQTWTGLLARGSGRRETACVWAGTREDACDVVRHVAFIDDQDEVRGAPYSHVAAPAAVARVLADLRMRGLVIVADLHTHPSNWVGLSDIDQANPIEFRVGLIALVLPNFASGERLISRVGVHEYVGEKRWRQLGKYEAATAIVIEESTK